MIITKETLHRKDYDGHEELADIFKCNLNGFIGWGDTPEEAKRNANLNAARIEEKESRQINDQFI